MLHSGRFGKQSRKSECFGPGKHPAPLSPPFTPLLQDHACMRDEAVHRDTRPELRPTSHQSRSLDCKIREHIGTITSASLVRGSHPVCIEKSARARVPVRVTACVCECVCAPTGVMVAIGRGVGCMKRVREGVSVFSAVHL